MAHIHNVLDTNLHFVIDPLTRQLRIDTEVETESKMVVIQYDHNSERVTFEIPKEVDGHDMSLCNVVQVHYLNVSTDGRTTASGVYEVEDLQVSGDVVVGTWLISQNATQLAGTLNFLIRFVCVTGDSPDYVWNTAVYQSIAVSSGLYHGEEIVVEYADILEQWRQNLIDSGGVTDDRIAKAVSDYLSENPVEAGSSVYIGAVQPIDGTLYWLDTSDTVSEKITYSVKTNLTNVTIDNAETNVSEGESFSATLTAETDFVLSTVKITMGGVNITNTSYADGNIYIASVTGDVVITAEATAISEEDKVYSVTNNLVGVTTDNSAVYVSENSAYLATLTVADGYNLNTVTVTMGGVDVTGDVYADGVITIEAVTGDVVITVTTVEQPEYNTAVAVVEANVKCNLYEDDGETVITGDVSSKRITSEAFDSDTEVEITLSMTSTSYGGMYVQSYDEENSKFYRRETFPKNGDQYFTSGKSYTYIYTIKAGCKLSFTVTNNNYTMFDITVMRKG